MDIILKYFPNLTPKQLEQFAALQGLYEHWNAQINVISRKDMENFYERHVLHSLGIAKYFEFEQGERVLDLGTGGGFPGIPLAILFPDTTFLLVDSVGKKIKVVNEVIAALGLQNVKAVHARVETIKEKFDFVVSRAVAPIRDLHFWTKSSMRRDPNKPIKNGLLCLKGGDLKEELADFKKHVRIYELAFVFEEEFFDTKRLLYVPL